MQTAFNGSRKVNVPEGKVEVSSMIGLRNGKGKRETKKSITRKSSDTDGEQTGTTSGATDKPLSFEFSTSKM